MRKLTKQNGTAIVVALFVTALVATIAVAMITRLHTDTRRTELLLNDIQANLNAEGEIDWAIEQLIQNWKFHATDKIVDAIPITSPVIAVDGTHLTAVITDEQAKLNLNNLTDPKYQSVFLRLLQTVSPDTSADQAKAILAAIIDWITPGVRNSTFDNTYTGLNPPYRAPHQMMTSISELHLVKGVTPKLFAKLAPYITALPELTQININTAEIPILMSLVSGMTTTQAKAIIAARKETPFVSVDRLAQFPGASSVEKSLLTILSQYFLTRTDVVMDDDQRMTIYTLMLRRPQQSTAVIKILWQSKGTL
ncbi:MAG: type II secretion system minor pseudopilin GspK [Gammaproteobacteria bacterium]|nr:type II secretion system minor pseudopilin GspK [Gammaproteobacteria bacterium]